jgi:hypothetical protein
MAKKMVGKRRLLLVLAAVVAIFVILLGAYQLTLNGHRYPQDALNVDSNLTVKGVVLSVEEGKISQGLGPNSYHIYHQYIILNITEIVWAEADGLSNAALNNSRSNIIPVGNENSDAPGLQVGQTVECKGYYLTVTDSPFSFKLNVAPSINGSYLKIL